MFYLLTLSLTQKLVAVAPKGMKLALAEPSGATREITLNGFEQNTKFNVVITSEVCDSYIHLGITRYCPLDICWKQNGKQPKT